MRESAINMIRNLADLHFNIQTGLSCIVGNKTLMSSLDKYDGAKSVKLTSASICALNLKKKISIRYNKTAFLQKQND